MLRERIKKLEGTLPLIAKRAASLKELVDKKLGSEHAWLELEQERVEHQHDLAALRNQLEQVGAAIEEAQQQRKVIQAEFRRTILIELTDTERRVEVLNQELIKATKRTTQQRLVAPIAGVVQQLDVHTIGGVVTPAQPLMVIVPQEGRLEVEAWLQNKDIGFVHEQQPAEVKVETFPFTKYGTIDAEIVNLSNDAVTDEEKGLVYAARVLLERSTIQVQDKLVNLTPGMAVTVEIKTGKRKLIEYILSPLLRYSQESVRER